MNPVRLRQRAAITLALRQWFEEHGYLESVVLLLNDVKQQELADLRHQQQHLVWKIAAAVAKMKRQRLPAVQMRVH